MRVSSISFLNWRNLEPTTATFEPGINVLWGMNAQGKSNILESIYYFARGRSFRGAKDREFIRFGEDFAHAEMKFRKKGYLSDTSLEVTIPKNGKKVMKRNGAPLSSTAEMIGNFRAVLFSPSNLALVSGGPLERRTFLDIALSQLSETYLMNLRRYSKALAERNALIKLASDGKSVSSAEWEMYARLMSTYGTWITSFRQEYSRYLEDAVRRYFDEMTGGKESPELRYTSHGLYEGIPSPLYTVKEEPDGTALYEKLTSNIEREIAAGTTLYGVHKDDINIMFNGHEAKAYASQGQQRSIALSMKLAEAEISFSVGGEYPVILLDDVFSELDESRRSYILDKLGKEELRQIIITSCEPDVVPDDRQSRVNFTKVSAGGIE